MNEKARSETIIAYRRGLAEHKEAMSALCASLSAEAAEARLEHHFECLRDWSLFGDLDDMKAWFKDLREKCTMVVEELPLNQCRKWAIDPETGNVGHESGAFFRIHGVRVTYTDTREVGSAGWDQPIEAEVGGDGGLLGILRQRMDGIPHYLVEAKAEPGNYGKLQLSPTLQATFSNLKRAHGGRKPRFAEYFEEPERCGARVLYRAWLSEDGGRLYLKRNCGMLVEAAESAAIEVPPGFRWASMYQLKALLHEDAWVNPHIRGIIAHL